MIVLVTLGVGLICAAGLSFLGGVLMFAYQLVLWLRSGAWESIIVTDIVSESLSDSTIQWLNYPTDWFGLAEAVRHVLQAPLSLELVILSGPLFLFGLLVANIGGRNL